MKPTAKNAIVIGSTCAIAYLIVYFARNILSIVSPKMIESGAYTTEDIGSLSSVFFIAYAIGQLINGFFGDKIKTKYMMSLGLFLAGLTNIVFAIDSIPFSATYISYALCGFFLSMIYGPMTKLVAENTEPVYASRCSVAYNFSSFLGSPLAGIVAVLIAWQMVFLCGAITLMGMGVICFTVFTVLERKGIIKYNQAVKNKNKNNSGVKTLIERKIIKFTLISILTGIVRTTVVFWLPTYLSQHLGFSTDTSALIFTVSTLAISVNAFIAIFIYEKLNRNLDITLIISFSSSAFFFGGCIFITHPVVNIIFMILAILTANCASSMLWSRYCPGLRSTGMVSTATGFLDFVSYLSASVSSTIFAGAVDSIGWKGLIVVWFALMAIGVIVAIPFGKKTDYLD